MERNKETKTALEAKKPEGKVNLVMFFVNYE